MSEFTRQFSSLDNALEKLAQEGFSQQIADEIKHCIRLTLEAACDLDHGPKRSIEALLQQVGQSVSGKRKAATVLVRALSEPLILVHADQHLILSLVESGIGDVLQVFNYPGRRAQTHQKIAALQSIYPEMRQIVTPLQNSGETLKEILGRRQEFLRILSDKKITWYVQQIECDSLKAEAVTIFNSIYELLQSHDSGLGSHLEELGTQLATFVQRRNQNSVSLVKNSFQMFLQSALDATELYRTQAHDRLQSIVVPASTDEIFAEKKYPLHEPERIVTVTVPLINRGPSLAYDVRAKLVCPTEHAIVNGEVSLGTVQVGPFQLAVQIMIVEPVSSLALDGTITWRSLADPKRRSHTWQMRLAAQNAAIDWVRLEREEPYSTSIAEGKEFVGRTNKLQAIARRLVKSSMQSTYITGQKRVGKTSLAKAVISYVQNMEGGREFVFNYIEWGEYARPDARATVEALGELMAATLAQDLPVDMRPAKIDFAGSLAPLIQLAKRASQQCPKRRFVFVLDEFDEIHPEMYRFGPLAEALFSNLRTLSSQKNVAFVLVGGEKMPYVMRAQGDQLNKFVREAVSYFSEATDWTDFSELVEGPVRGSLEWRHDAIREVFSVTNGHPYYAKLLCARIFQNAIGERDSDITVTEVRRATVEVVASQDVNAFAHFWKDGIDGGKEEEESRALKRAKLLSMIGRLMRRDKDLTVDAVTSSPSGFQLAKVEIQALIREFCARDILKEDGELLFFLIPIFGLWIEETGADKITGDAYIEEISRRVDRDEEAARISSSEIQELCEKWPPYQGQQITTDRVRAWFEQVPSLRDQRMLFTLLKNLRFPDEFDVRKKLSLGYSMVLEHSGPLVRQTKTERRTDVIVTYLDGHAKSGHFYATRFAEGNDISAECVMPADQLNHSALALEDRRKSKISAIVIVDDMAGTGNTMADNAAEFLSAHRAFLTERNAFVGIVLLVSTVEGETKIRARLRRIQGVNVDLRVCEPLRPDAIAFPEGLGFWKDNHEKERAKALCRDLGALVSQRTPLGYGDQGLLIVFPENCPNNSLPILHGTSKGERPWKPLFPRFKN